MLSAMAWEEGAQLAGDGFVEGRSKRAGPPNKGTCRAAEWRRAMHVICQVLTFPLDLQAKSNAFAVLSAFHPTVTLPGHPLLGNPVMLKGLTLRALAALRTVMGLNCNTYTPAASSACRRS